MAASDARKTEAVQPATDGKWVFVHSAGDAEKEELLEEQDGDVIGEKENTPNAAEGQESAQDTDKYLWWLRSGWNDVSVRNALWDDMRPYVLIAALFVYAVLQVLVALASLAQCNAPHALFISLKHFASATLNAAVLSLVTRCASLTVVKASTVKKALHPRLSDTGDFVFLIILVACFACVYEIGGGIKVFQESRREEDFQWFLQLLADMARVHVLTAAIVLTASLVFLMGNRLGSHVSCYSHARTNDGEVQKAHR
ncbi:hypothetical protein MTO96_025544 [Rhipicephalus appendiculatus]